jgi:hypothetical protein
MRILLFICLLSFSLSGFAQNAFEKNKNYIDLGIGLGIYNTEIEEDLFNTVDRDKAASVIVPLSYERGLTDMFGLGAQLVFAKYLTDSASSDDNFRSTDFAINANLHVLKKEKIDLCFGLTAGFTGLKMTNSSTFSYKGNGGMMGLNMTFKVMPAENAGFYLKFGGLGYNVDGDFSESGSGLGFGAKIRARGFNIGAGLALKF